jgi:YgiT-type zinc finger domain-containing protein
MKCLICKNGETQFGPATMTLERGDTVVVVRGIPAQVCDNCGEPYFDGTTTDQLLAILEQAVQSGVQVDVRHYKAA